MVWGIDSIGKKMLENEVDSDIHYFEILKRFLMLTFYRQVLLLVTNTCHQSSTSIFFGIVKEVSFHGLGWSLFLLKKVPVWWDRSRLLVFVTAYIVLFDIIKKKKLRCRILHGSDKKNAREQVIVKEKPRILLFATRVELLKFAREFIIHLGKPICNQQYPFHPCMWFCCFKANGKLMIANWKECEYAVNANELND